MDGSIRGEAAIVGVAEAGVGVAPPGSTPLDLIGWATVEALREAGLHLSDVDGLFSASAYYHMPTMSIAEYLGIRPRYSDSSNLGGSSFVSHLFHAAAALALNLCRVALVVYGSTQRSDRGGLVSASELLPLEAPYRPRYPVTMFALAAARHMHEFGTTRRQLAEVAVSARAWAQLTPGAFARDPLTVEDVLASRPISTPLHARDCCLVTDGGAAVVLVRADRSSDSPTPAVYVLGAGETHSHRNISQMPDLVRTDAAQSSARAFQMARVGPPDIDVVEVYDAFTINTILYLEDLGFCKKGEGGPFVSSGRIAPGGDLPVNTNGGGLSYCHPGMYGLFLVVEAVRQLRGVAGERQVTGADVALVHGGGGVLASHVTAILGTEATL